MAGKSGQVARAFTAFMQAQLSRVRQRAIWSWDGFVHVLRTEGSLAQWLWANVASATMAFILPLTAGERALILMGGVFVLALECLNTAIERVVDDVSTAERPLAKQAKDAGSAAVAIAGIAVGIAWLCLLAGMIWR